MRILFLSPIHPLLTFGNPLPKWQMQASWVRALERQGHEISVVKYTPDDRIRLNWRERILWNIRVIKRIRVIRWIDLIILSLGADVLFPQTIRLIKWLIKAPLVVLSGVSPVLNGNPREKEMAKLVDLAGVNDQKQADEWIKLGAKKAVVLPISAMDPELHRERRIKGNGGERDIDILFVGTMTEERRQFFDRLRKLLPDRIKMAIKEFVWEEEYAELMSRVKIVLNPIRPEMAFGANLRMFEIPAFGALELGSFAKKEWLMPGKEMLIYRDAEEAAGLIVEYLKDGKKREAIVKKGQRRVIREHKFEDRARRLMEIINVDCNKVRPLTTKAGPLIDVSVCIVNYKTDRELGRCVASIKKFTKGVSYEIIVIDNSVDNRWYSGGNNLALAQAEGKYVLFFNPDCYLTENSLEKLVSWMDKHPEVGASEPRQVYDSGEIAPTGSLLPVWWVDLVELTELSQLFGSVGRLGGLERLGKIREIRQEDMNRREDWKTEMISGAAMMVRKKVLDQIGGFDEQFKLYYTDVDLCRRILEAGFEVWHLGEFKLGHSTRKSTGKMKWDDVYDIYAKDAWNYYKKWDSRIGAGLLFIGMKINMFGIYLYRFLIPPKADRQARNNKERFMKLTTIVLVGKNDEIKAKRAIDSVSFAGEVIVVKEKFPISDFSEVRNRALDRDKGEWILFVDSDEEMNQQLAREIKRIVEFSIFNFQFSNNGYFLRRQDKFLGKWLKYGETASVKLLRLAKKDAGRWIRPVHEVWKVEGKIGELKNPLLHYSHETVEGMVEKLDRYSEIEGEYRSRSQVSRLTGYQVITEMIIFPVGKFVQNYILRLGLLDGMEGFIHAGMMSFHSFLVRAKMLIKKQKTENKEQ